MLRVAAVVEQCWHRVPGGTARATVCTLEALVRRDDLEVVGIAARHRRPPPEGLRPPLEVRTVPLPRKLLYDSWHQLRRPAVQSFCGQVDVVHATGGVVPPSRSAALVVTVYDLAFLHRPEHFTKRGVRFLTRGFDLARALADVVVVPSQATAADCCAHRIDSERIRVVPMGVTMVEPAAEQIDSVRSRHGLPESFALWVGTAEPRKNLGGLLAAMERVSSDIPLVLVGPDGWATDVAALVAACDHEVIRLGWVADSELAALYAAARVFVYPSLLEGFGLPVLEAMAQGTPVITSSGTATAEVCGAAGQLIDPADPEALAEAIDRVVADDSGYEQRQAAARARAALFSWEATAAGVLAAYRDACS